MVWQLLFVFIKLRKVCLRNCYTTQDIRFAICQKDKRQRKTSYLIRPDLRPTFRKEQPVSYHAGRGNA